MWPRIGGTGFQPVAVHWNGSLLRLLCEHFRERRKRVEARRV
jgi:hypothetical protein